MSEWRPRLRVRGWVVGAVVPYRLDEEWRLVRPEMVVLGVDEVFALDGTELAVPPMTVLVPYDAHFAAMAARCAWGFAFSSKLASRRCATLGLRSWQRR
ncbi:hypothetical protein [Lacticaseibacillus absianus]|uniref:hypothetical protein n=1 Tax=Lacticaseibacillus absianus TaxID=2729623 RepID=UPI0015CA219E|nr:hypothetical protein [Lacticaseibacillus absianus]